MQDHINSYKDKTKIKKKRISKLIQKTSKVNIFDSINFNDSKKCNDYTKKKRNRILSDKKTYFKAEKNSKLYKKKSSHDSIYNYEIWTKNQKNKFSKENILSGINWKKVKEFPLGLWLKLSLLQKYFFIE